MSAAVVMGSSTWLLTTIPLLLFVGSRPLRWGRQQEPDVESHSIEQPQDEEAQEPDTVDVSEVSSPAVGRIYRQPEWRRATAALKANSPILITGEEGSGKSVLVGAIVDGLREEGFRVAYCEPATPKQMLLEISEQLGVATTDLEGKAFTADQLKRQLTNFMEQNTAFLVVDDAHLCEAKFRLWLKQLKRSGCPMLLAATDPPRSDVFINLPRIELSPLSEYAIRELMEQAALERGISLKTSDLARLQERAGGNPMLAQRCIDEEYLGLDIEGGDHRRYADATPLILLAGIVFVAMRFIALGTNNQALYVMTGILGAVAMGISRLLYNLPRESRRIQ